MKKVFTLIAAVMLLMLSACGQKTEIKYLETSVTQEYIGTVTFRTTKAYDSEGKLLSTVQYYDDEEVSKSTYLYEENSVTMQITQNDQTSTMQQIFEKDDSGNIVHTDTYMDDVLYYTTDSTYDENGNMLTNVQNTILIGANYTTTYTYDDQGNQIKMTFDYGNGSGSVIENTYDGNSKLLTSVTCDLQGEITSQEEHTWNDAGVELVSIYDPEGNLTATRSITYDEVGNILTSETYDPSGELTARIMYTYEKIEIPVNN